MNNIQKTFWLLILVLFGRQVILPQENDISLTASDFEFNYSSTSIHQIIGHDIANFYVIKHQLNQYYLEKLDNDLNLLKEEPIKLHEGLKTYTFETIVHFHDELYIFISKRRFKNITLYYQKIDKSTLLPSTEKIEITTMEFIKGNWSDFHFALSKKETKLLIACPTKVNLSKVQFNEYFVFDKGLKLLWKRKDSFEYTRQGPQESEYLVDEHGNVSILSVLKRENPLDLFRSVKNIYILFRIINEGQDFYQYPLTYENRYIRGVKIVAADNGDLVCVGMYSEMYNSGVRGTFFFKIDPVNGQIYDHRMQDFNSQFLEQLAEINEPIISGEELIEYVATDLLLRDNDRIILIAEQFFNQTYNTYNNILLTCFNPDGSIYWNQVIPKQQSYDIRHLQNSETEPQYYREYIRNTGILDLYNEHYCSYALIAPIDKNELVFVFNDHIKNLQERKRMKSFGNPRRSYISAVKVDEYGNLSKQILTKWKRKKAFPKPMRYYDTLYDSIVIPAFRGRKYNYYKVVAEL